jgi:hypothetical protein
MPLMRRLLLIAVCAALALGAPLSFGSVAQAPCDTAQAGDMDSMPECGCGTPDKGTCAAHCNAMSPAQLLASPCAPRIDWARAAPAMASLDAFRSVAGPPRRHPPK